MAEHRLDIPDVGTALQHQRRHAVAEQVARTALAGVGRIDVAAHELGQPVGRERLSSVVRNSVPSSVPQARSARTSSRYPLAKVTIDPPQDMPALAPAFIPATAPMPVPVSVDAAIILADFVELGVVGESTNVLTGYLACVSRLLDRPLAIIIQSSSAAGKSSLMDAVLALMPGDAQVRYSAMTGQSLFYMGETNLKHRILAIAEEEGAQSAGYALKLLQSDGAVTIASTGKDAATGNLVTREYRVEGPVMLFLTTTAIDIDEELLNRCLVLSVDETRDQTRAIHILQRRRQTLEGLLASEDREGVQALHRNAQSAAGTPKRGSCHRFRLTMATLMLEGGADIRFIQAMLGHAELSTTQIYTQVSIRTLKQIHTATHPGRPITVARHDDDGDTGDASDRAETLLAALDAETDEEE